MGFKSLFTGKNNVSQMTTKMLITSQSPSFSVHSPAQLAIELEEVFKKFDINGDGKISSSELGSMMESLGQVLSEEELVSMIHEVDVDGDGFINLQEFIELNTKGVDSIEVMAILKDAFSVFDIDGNGVITVEELQMVMKSLGDDCSMAKCRKMISSVDSDSNGIIDFEEFKVMMMMGSRHDSIDRVKAEAMGE